VLKEIGSGEGKGKENKISLEDGRRVFTPGKEGRGGASLLSGREEMEFCGKRGGDGFTSSVQVLPCSAQSEMFLF